MGGFRITTAAECSCKADRFRENYDCKHKLAVASISGSVVLQPAVDCPTRSADTERTNPSALADTLRFDGSVVVADADTDSPTLDAGNHEMCVFSKYCGNELRYCREMADQTVVQSTVV